MSAYLYDQRRLSDELEDRGIPHSLVFRDASDHAGWRVESVTGFRSVRAFADALLAAGYDAAYGAASGWSFRRLSAPDEAETRADWPTRETGAT